MKTLNKSLIAVILGAMALTGCAATAQYKTTGGADVTQYSSGGMVMTFESWNAAPSGRHARLTFVCSKTEPISMWVADQTGGKNNFGTTTTELTTYMESSVDKTLTLKMVNWGKTISGNAELDYKQFRSMISPTVVPDQLTIFIGGSANIDAGRYVFPVGNIYKHLVEFESMCKGN